MMHATGWALYGLAIIALAIAIWRQAGVMERAHGELAARRSRHPLRAGETEWAPSTTESAGAAFGPASAS